MPAAPYRIDAFGGSLTRFGEVVCGSLTQILQNEERAVAILADGNAASDAAAGQGGPPQPGSSAAAAARASLTAGMLSSLLRAGRPVEEAAGAVAQAQPKSGLPGTSFTVAELLVSGGIALAQYRMPPAAFLLRGRPVKIGEDAAAEGLFTARVPAGTADTVAAFSGVPGRGTPGAPAGLTGQAAAVFLQNAYQPRISAQRLAKLLLQAGNTLCRLQPSEDFSVLVFRFLRLSPRGRAAGEAEKQLQ